MSLENLRKEVAATLKVLDDRQLREQQQQTKFDQQASVRDLPVERMRRGEVDPKHLRTANYPEIEAFTSNLVRRGLLRSQYEIPANSEPILEMFKGSDIPIQTIQTRQLRLED